MNRIVLRPVLLSFITDVPSAIAVIGALKEQYPGLHTVYVDVVLAIKLDEANLPTYPIPGVILRGTTIEPRIVMDIVMDPAYDRS